MKKAFVTIMIILLLTVSAFSAVFTVKANDISNAFKINIPKEKLTLGSLYFIEMELLLDDIDSMNMVISYDPSEIKFTKYSTSEELKVSNYNNDEVTGALAIDLQKIEVITNKKIITIEFMPLKINEISLSISYLSYAINGENIKLNSETFNFNVVDLYDYTEFIKAVKKIDGGKLLSEYENIKTAMSLMTKFNKDIVSTEEAKQAVRLLDKCFF